MHLTAPFLLILILLTSPGAGSVLVPIVVAGGPVTALLPSLAAPVAPPSVIPGILPPKKYASVAVVGVEGGEVRMPCNITVPAGDAVFLVLWFREGLATPIYSYDLREVSGPTHWHDASLLGDRAEFRADPLSPYLLLSGITPRDAGLYKCRVDFQKAPTTNSRVNVTIVVPPSSVALQDEEGLPVQSVIGPVMEGSNLRISCLATGGSPPPDLDWVVSPHTEHTAHQTRTSGVTISHLVLKSLSRDLVMSEVTCRAYTASITPPMTASATIDMNLRPVEVTISDPVEPLSAGRTYDLMCTSRGSRPPALLTWWKGTQRLRPIADQTWQEGNVSRSVLRLAVNSSLHEQNIVCRAHNPNVPDAVVQDNLMLSVYYVPIVSVRFGASLDPSQIRERDDVYFECQVNSNPAAYKVTWQHEGQDVRQDRDHGILVTANSLVLQHVQKRHSGAYTCRASNVEGDSTSKPMQLDIHYAPVCREGLVSTYGVAAGETARVQCAVDAVPQVHRFFWVFNNTAESLSVPEGAFTSKSLKGSSVLDYTPTNDFEYGTLLCLAENSVAKQQQPCVFQIVPAAKPQSPSECKVTNVTPSSVSVACTAGFGGGLKQSFFLEVRSTDPKVLQANVSSSKPEFLVSGLESGSGFLLTIYSGNSRGRSKTVVNLEVDLPSLPVKQLETRHDTEGSSVLSKGGPGRPDPDGPVFINYVSLLGAFAGTIIALAAVALVAALSYKRRCCGVRAAAQRTDQEDQLTDSQNYYAHNQPPHTTTDIKIDVKGKPDASGNKDAALLQANVNSSANTGGASIIITRGKSSGTTAKESSGSGQSSKCSVLSLTSLSKETNVTSPTLRDQPVRNAICVSPSTLEVKLFPAPHPQFSNHSFIFDEKGPSCTTPPEPAPPDPFLQGNTRTSLATFPFSCLGVQTIQSQTGNSTAGAALKSTISVSSSFGKDDGSKLQPDRSRNSSNYAGTRDPRVAIAESGVTAKTAEDCRRESSV